MSLIVRDFYGAQKYLPFAGVDPSYVIGGTLTTPADTNAADMLVFKGAAGVISRLRKLRLALISGGTAATVLVKLVRQTAIAGGSTAYGTPAPCDINDPAAQTQVLTPGGAGTGAVVLFEDLLPLSGVAGAYASLEIDVAKALAKPLALVSATDFIAINFKNSAAAAENLTVYLNATIDETVVGSTGEI